MIIKLNLKEIPSQAIDARNLSPDVLCGLSQSQIEQHPIGRNQSELLIGDLFEVDCYEHSIACEAESPSEQSIATIGIVVNGELGRFQRIGQGMSSGFLWINGSVGFEFASRMSGGVCVVVGHVSDNAAQAFRGGLLAICGHCGHNLACPLPGKKTGMTGGDILIGGNVGDRAAHRMRRGTILISGHAGQHGCQQMIAGTVVVQGTVGDSWCIGMKRGSLIELNSGDSASSTHAGFTMRRDFELSFLQILWKHLRVQHRQAASLGHELGVSFPFALPKFPRSNWVTRQVGDTLVSGQGEWLRVINPDQANFR